MTNPFFTTAIREAASQGCNRYLETLTRHQRTWTAKHGAHLALLEQESRIRQNQGWNVARELAHAGARDAAHQQLVMVVVELGNLKALQLLLAKKGQRHLDPTNPQLHQDAARMMEQETIILSNELLAEWLRGEQERAERFSEERSKQPALPMPQPQQITAQVGTLSPVAVVLISVFVLSLFGSAVFLAGILLGR